MIPITAFSIVIYSKCMSGIINCIVLSTEQQGKLISYSKCIIGMKQTNNLLVFLIL